MRPNYFYGPRTCFGLAVAVIACLIDQASKLYLLFVFDLANHPLRLGPFFDFVLTRNTGISYGLFQTQGALGQWVLLGFKALAVVLLWLWLARSPASDSYSRPITPATMATSARLKTYQLNRQFPLET